MAYYMQTIGQAQWTTYLEAVHAIYNASSSIVQSTGLDALVG